MDKLRLAVHKFASCDGCQLSLLNAVESLLAMTPWLVVVHFAEAGVVAPDAEADVALVEGSIATPEDAERIQAVRAQSGLLVSLGTCATAGGIQALRNGRMHGGDWLGGIYPRPDWLAVLDRSTPLSEHVRVDVELPGCPVNAARVFALLRDAFRGVRPAFRQESVCMACKRAGHACVVVSQALVCLGPVTAAGCGALCPAVGRGCYGCFGPAEQVNAKAVRALLAHQNLDENEARARLVFIAAGSAVWRRAGGEGD